MKPVLVWSACLFIFLPLPALGAGVVIINEVAWMGSLPKTGETASQAANNEWIELKNTTSSGIDLGGWKLAAQDGAPDIDLTGVIPASGFFLLERTSDDTVPGVQADQIYVGALSNSGERLFLKNASGAVIDELDASSGWPAGDNDTKQTMQFVGYAWLTASSTPRAENGAPVAAGPSPPASSPAPTGQSQGAAQTSPPAVATPLSGIRTYAGEDKVVAAGSLTEFIGEAIGPKNEPLVNPHFWWNFGDGANKEGRVVSHIFQVPGKYTVGMHVSSGSDARSDYLSVTVVPNQIKVKNVLIGEGGYITLFNPAGTEIDIGEWALEDGAGRKFFLPSRTKIGPNAEIALTNRVTGLFKDGASRAILRYPNSLLAFEWKEEAVGASLVVPIASSSHKEAAKTALLPEEFPLTAATAVAAISGDLAQISSPPLNFSSKIFFLSAFLVSIIAASLYLIIRIF